MHPNLRPEVHLLPLFVLSEEASFRSWYQQFSSWEETIALRAAQISMPYQTQFQTRAIKEDDLKGHPSLLLSRAGHSPRREILLGIPQ